MSPPYRNNNSSHRSRYRSNCIHMNMTKNRKNIILILMYITISTYIFHIASSFSVSNNQNYNLNNKSNNNTNNSNPKLSASQRARREEEERRLSRINENIPGKTSAIPGAKDYEINIANTELEWSRQATPNQVQIRELTNKGIQAFRMLQLEDADSYFNQVYQLNPSAYCYHAGVVKFYLGEYLSAARLFVKNAITYESKFQQLATEERIWSHACLLKLRSSHHKFNENTINASIPYSIPKEHDSRMMDSLPPETRKVLKIAQDLFSSSVQNDLSSAALARARLLSTTGAHLLLDDNNQNDNDMRSLPINDRKMRKTSSWYYLGLHYDVIGNVKCSKICMKLALKQSNTSGNGSDIIHTLPILHMSVRDWYDDDDISQDIQFNDLLVLFPPDQQINDMPESTTSIHKDDAIQENPSIPTTSTTSNVVSSLSQNSIRDSVNKMKLVELQNALKKRKLKSSGAKSILQNRLLTVLLEEAASNIEEY